MKYDTCSTSNHVNQKYKDYYTNLLSFNLIDALTLCTCLDNVLYSSIGEILSKGSDSTIFTPCSASMDLLILKLSLVVILLDVGLLTAL